MDYEENSNAGHKDDYNASFRDTVWLQSFPLTQQTVLHYFALSQFYDRNCNNERLKMQRLDLDRLKSMRGIEYELIPPPVVQQPQMLFLIRKQRRISATQAKPLAVYYILDGTIYQAPNIFAILTSRLSKCSYRINEAFHELRKGVEFGANEGYAWNFSTKDKKMKAIPSEKLAQNLRRMAERQEKQKESNMKVDSIIVSLLKKYVPDVLNNAAKEVDKATDPTLDQSTTSAAIVETQHTGENPVKKQKVA